jgi:Zn-dependent peptidase ImmA (M78 family)/DNA-binding XRE family transcriptional regulator
MNNQLKPANPKMVILGRESRGLSQKKLAQALDVTQGTISKIETGLIPVSNEMIEMLSQVLNYPPHFFRQEGDITSIGIAEIFHRKRQSVPQHVLNRIYAQIEIRIKHVYSLLLSVEIPSNIPKMDVDEYSGQVEEIARAVRTRWQIPRGPIQDVTEVIEDAGGIIIALDFETLFVDAISRWIPGLPPLFFVNEHIPKDRYRLSLVHELGHIVMHTYPTPDIEEQAFRFAAEFLLPERDVIMDLRNLNLPKLVNLKRYWRVSMSALLKRSEELQAIKPNQARYLWSQMAKAGYKTREPIELDISGEQPHLLRELIEAHQKELGYSLDDLRILLPLNEDELWAYYLEDPSHPRPRLRLVKADDNLLAK